MKIYYITDIKLDNSTAQTVHVDQICTHLIELGHDVVLYAPWVRDYLPENSNYQTNLLKSQSFAKSIFFQLNLFFTLFFSIRKNRPQVIYSRHSLLLFMPNVIGKLFGIPVVLEVNGRLIDEVHQQILSKLGVLLLNSGLYSMLEKYNFKTASRMVVVTEGIKDFMHQTYSVEREKIDVVSNGVNTTLFQPQIKAEAQKQVGFTDDVIYVGYLGSFFSWQGLRYVADAALLMKDSHQKVKFVLIGGGEDSEYLENFVTEHGLQDTLIIISSVTRDLVPSYINAVDICLSVPTRFREGSTSPFKVYEYLACGKAVIQSDIKGMRDEFLDVVRYVEPESSEALVEGIQVLINSPQERSRLGDIGHQFIEAERSWRSVTEKIINICSQAQQVKS